MFPPKRKGRQAKDIAGQRFGLLIAIEPTPDRYHGSVVWLTKCDCGNELKAPADSLTKGRTASCGCRTKNGKGGIGALRGTGERSHPAADRYFYSVYQVNARTRGYEFLLSPDELASLLHSHCFYCGVEPSASDTRTPGYTRNGVDRFDNTGGYTLENSVPCCEECNYFKGSMSGREFLDRVRRIYEHRFKGQ